MTVTSPVNENVYPSTLKRVQLRNLSEAAKENTVCSSTVKTPQLNGKSSAHKICKNIGDHPAEKCLTINNMSPAIKVLEYAVQGPLFLRAAEIEKELGQGVKKPFSEVVKANMGDCHAMGQKHVTFIRQVVAAVALPALLDDPKFPEDVKVRAKDILAHCRGNSAGSYAEPAGIEIIRKHVAEHIQRRDGGVPADWQDIILCAGASDGVQLILKLFLDRVDNKPPGFLIPIPQYPLYTASLAEFSMPRIEYYLDEENNWSLDISELERSITEGRKYCHPRAIVVINPGNPTGQVLRRENIEEIIQFAYREKLFIIADEVYQDNIYAEGSVFHSFKKVLCEMGEPFSKMELVSVMSVSKGYMGECGIRGGYIEVLNLDPLVKAQLIKFIMATLTPTTLGQVVVDCIANPPREGEPSYRLFNEERGAILKSLAKRAKLVAEVFEKMDGISCQPVQGSMYAFPKLELPVKAIAKAKSLSLDPSEFYAIELLEKAGIFVVPGAGFGQKPGTYHIRTTILPQMDQLNIMLAKFKDFHEKFVAEYS